MEMVGKIRSKGVVKEASSAMPSDLKYENRWQVLRVFRDGGEYTANDVAAKTGISRQTTMKAIRFFCNRGLLRSSGKGDSTDIGGKKPEHFTFYCKSYLLCIAMWPGRMGLTLFDLVRHRLDYMEGELPPYLTLEEAFERLETLSDVFLTRNGVPLSELYGVGLSTAGVVDYKSGNLRYNAYTPQWGRDVPIASRLYRLYGNQVVVYVENAGSGAFYTRVKITPEVVAANGEIIPLDASKRLLTLDLNDSDWVPGTDGYYYYTGALAPQAATSKLFNHVTFSTDMGNEYQNTTVHIYVTAEAVQTANLEKYAAKDVRDVWKHVGTVEASTSSTQIDPIPTA